MLTDDVISERAYIVGDVASVTSGMRSIELLLASRAITRHCAQDVLEQCAEDLRQLAARLRCIDASVRGTAVHNV